jgi:hypothetical protein
MTAYSPFCLTDEVMVNHPPEEIWGMLAAPQQSRWNKALPEFSASMGTLTGSIWQLVLQTLSGPKALNLEVLESQPPQHLQLEHKFRYWLLSHRLVVSIHCLPIDPNRTRLSMSFSIDGYFASRYWSRFAHQFQLSLDLWLNSIKEYWENQ